MYSVKDDALAAHAIASGDRIVVERDQPLRTNRIALVKIGAALEIVHNYREGERLTFDGAPTDDCVSVEVIGVASR